jgi:hypothetical protein
MGQSISYPGAKDSILLLIGPVLRNSIESKI